MDYEKLSNYYLAEYIKDMNKRLTILEDNAGINGDSSVAERNSVPRPPKGGSGETAKIISHEDWVDGINSRDLIIKEKIETIKKLEAQFEEMEQNRLGLVKANKELRDKNQKLCEIVTKHNADRDKLTEGLNKLGLVMVSNEY
jgi:hypothetical protein